MSIVREKNLLNSKEGFHLGLIEELRSGVINPYKYFLNYAPGKMLLFDQ